MLYICIEQCLLQVCWIWPSKGYLLTGQIGSVKGNIGLRHVHLGCQKVTGEVILTPLCESKAQKLSVMSSGTDNVFFFFYIIFHISTSVRVAEQLVIPTWGFGFESNWRWDSLISSGT